MTTFIRLAGWAALFVWVLFAPAAPAGEIYYMSVFAYQTEPNAPRTAHTFATFVKVSYQHGMDPRTGRLETHTISWLPASLDVALLRGPEPGKNLDLATTLQLGKKEGATIYAWGPYRIRKELYDDALTQIQRLNRGEVEYKALDHVFGEQVSSNCIHAVSDIVGGPSLDTGTAHGAEASAMVVEHLSPWVIIDRNENKDWLVGRLGLGKEPIVFDSQPLAAGSQFGTRKSYHGEAATVGPI